MNAQRLLKLADFLDTLPRAKFDFGVVTHEGGKPMREALKAGKTRCGTVGCAIGWMPAVWPRAVKWRYFTAGLPCVVLAGESYQTAFYTAAKWFDITYEQAAELFHPAHSSLSESATPKQVARHIRKFVARERA